MEETQNIFETSPWLLPLIIILTLWEMVWKLIALWKAGRNNHLHWFLLLALVNSAGIMPIVYILKCRKKSNS